jgi:hypothetical protein
MGDDGGDDSYCVQVESSIVNDGNPKKRVGSWDKHEELCIGDGDGVCGIPLGIPFRDNVCAIVVESSIVNVGSWDLGIPFRTNVCGIVNWCCVSITDEYLFGDVGNEESAVYDDDDDKWEEDEMGDNGGESIVNGGNPKKHVGSWDLGIPFRDNVCGIVNWLCVSLTDEYSFGDVGNEESEWEQDKMGDESSIVNDGNPTKHVGSFGIVIWRCVSLTDESPFGDLGNE